MQIDENQPDETGSKPVESEEPKTRRAFSRLKRELTDDELSSTGVQKMLLEYLAQAEEENVGLKSFRDRYYQADKLNGVLQEKLKSRIAAEIVSMGSLAVGSAAIGYAPSAWASQPSGGLALAFGIVLTVVGIAAKVVRQ